MSCFLSIVSIDLSHIFLVYRPYFLIYLHLIIFILKLDILDNTVWQLQKLDSFPSTGFIVVAPYCCYSFLFSDFPELTL